MNDHKHDQYDKAMDYAWKWFEFHAGQRLSVFRFFLIAVAFISTGYITAIVRDRIGVATGLAILLGIVTFLFWRLDIRNLHLVKIAEAPLKIAERKLSEDMGVPEIRLAHEADERPKFEKNWLQRNVFRHCYSFRQIYQVLFGFIGIVALLGLLLVLFYYVSGPYNGSPNCDRDVNVRTTESD